MSDQRLVVNEDELVADLIQNNLIHEIHTSERRSFRACRRRWDWLFRQNYYPKVTAKPLEFGSAFHVGMETYYDPTTWDWDREVIGQQAILDFVEKCEEQKKAALELMNQNLLDADVEEDYQERVELGRGMLTYYFNEVAPVVDKSWKPVKVEIAFRVPIKHPETGEKYIWCKCDRCWNRYLEKVGFHESTWNADSCLIALDQHDESELRDYHWWGLPVCYEGRIDMLAQDENGNYWVFDWKTARTISDNDEFLYLDDQVGSYVWALVKLGLPVRGFVYHEQRKGYPLPPKKNKNRRLGRWFSVSKNQDTDYDTFLKTVREEDREAYEEGLYDEFLDFLRNEGIVYFRRHQIHKSAEELESIEEAIGQEVLDMIDPSLRIYPSAGRFGCGFCAFRQPCMEKNSQSDYQYALDTMFEKRQHYYVREEPSTESKGGE